MADGLRIIVIEREPLFRRGVVAALEGMSGVGVVRQAGTLADGLRLLVSHRPDLAIVGTSLPDAGGMAAVVGLHRRSDALKIVVLGEGDWDDERSDALRAGAAAYAGKDITEDRLVELVRRTADGLVSVEDRGIVQGSSGRSPSSRARSTAKVDSPAARTPLTARELQVLRGVSGGQTNAEIGDILGISAQTVKNHVTAILRKLGVNDRTQAVVLALRRGWISIEDVPIAPRAPETALPPRDEVPA